MRRVYIVITLFILLALEGVALDFLPQSMLNSQSLIVSHWVFVFMIYIALYFDTEKTYHGVTMAAIFGLLIDIVYTDILGVYMFAYFVSIYIIFLLGRTIRINLPGSILLGVIGITMADAIIYLIYSFINVTQLRIEEYAYYRLLPTILANVIFLIILYPIFNKRLLRWREKHFKL